MDVGKLRLFVQVAQYGSLTKAANALDTVPPVISRSINALGTELGGRLFERTGRGMKLSPLGESLMPEVEALIASTDRLIDMARHQAKAASGQVQLGLLRSFSEAMSSRIIEAVNRDFPEINLRIQEGSIGQLEQWIEEGFLDLSMNLRQTGQRGDAETPIGTVPTYLVGAVDDPLMERGTIPFEDLGGLKLVLSAIKNGLRAELDAIAQNLDVTLHSVVETDSVPLSLNLAETSKGYTILSSPALWPAVEAGRVGYLRIVEPELNHQVALSYTLRRQPTMAAKEVGKIVERLAREELVSGSLRPLETAPQLDAVS